jgi:hypothetical protein
MTNLRSDVAGLSGGPHCKAVPESHILISGFTEHLAG